MQTRGREKETLREVKEQEYREGLLLKRYSGATCKEKEKERSKVRWKRERKRDRESCRDKESR